jgi:hypothetical protein
MDENSCKVNQMKINGDFAQQRSALSDRSANLALRAVIQFAIKRRAAIRTGI